MNMVIDTNMIMIMNMNMNMNMNTNIDIIHNIIIYSLFVCPCIITITTLI